MPNLATSSTHSDRYENRLEPWSSQRNTAFEDSTTSSDLPDVGTNRTNGSSKFPDMLDVEEQRKEILYHDAVLFYDTACILK